MAGKRLKTPIVFVGRGIAPPRTRPYCLKIWSTCICIDVLPGSNDAVLDEVLEDRSMVFAAPLLEEDIVDMTSVSVLALDEFDRSPPLMLLSWLAGDVGGVFDRD